MSQESLIVVNPKPFLNGLLGKAIICKLKWGQEYKGYLISIDGYMNIQMGKTKEYLDDIFTNKLGDVFIKGNNILYVRGLEREAQYPNMRD